MGGFGNTVGSLIETYSKCLSLLKGLTNTGDAEFVSGGLDGSPDSLRKSIRSDRSRLRRAYESQLSLNDGLKTGDGGFPSTHASPKTDRPSQLPQSHR